MQSPPLPNTFDTEPASPFVTSKSKVQLKLPRPYLSSEEANDNERRRSLSRPLPGQWFRKELDPFIARVHGKSVNNNNYAIPDADELRKVALVATALRLALLDSNFLVKFHQAMVHGRYCGQRFAELAKMDRESTTMFLVIMQELWRDRLPTLLCVPVHVDNEGAASGTYDSNSRRQRMNIIDPKLLDEDTIFKGPCQQELEYQEAIAADARVDLTKSSPAAEKSSRGTKIKKRRSSLWSTTALASGSDTSVITEPERRKRKHRGSGTEEGAKRTRFGPFREKDVPEPELTISDARMARRRKQSFDHSMHDMESLAKRLWGTGFESKDTEEA